MVIITYIEAWLNNQPKPNMSIIAPEASNILKLAVESQNRLGWNQFIYGRLSGTWSKVYQLDMDLQDTGIFKQTAKKWGTNIIELIMNFC